MGVALRDVGATIPTSRRLRSVSLISNRQSLINGICELLKPPFLYNILSEKID
jgi:hypothetical protein